MPDKERKFFGNIKENYESLREKEHELQEEKAKKYTIPVLLGTLSSILFLFCISLVIYAPIRDVHERIREGLYLTLVISYISIFILESTGIEFNIRWRKEIETTSYFSIIWILIYIVFLASSAEEALEAVHLVIILLMAMQFLASFLLKKDYAVYSRGAVPIKVIPLAFIPFGFAIKIPDLWMPHIWISYSIILLCIQLIWWRYKDKTVATMYNVIGEFIDGFNPIKDGIWLEVNLCKVLKNAKDVKIISNEYIYNAIKDFCDGNYEKEIRIGNPIKIILTPESVDVYNEYLLTLGRKGRIAKHWALNVRGYSEDRPWNVVIKLDKIPGENGEYETRINPSL